MAKARGFATYMLAGGLTDNRMFLAAVVWNGDGGNQRLLTTSSPLMLVQQRPQELAALAGSSSTEVPAASTYETVDARGDGFKVGTT